MSYIVRRGQTMEDVAMANYGTIEAVVAIALANELAVDTELAAGQELELPEFDKAANEYVPPAPGREAQKYTIHTVRGQTLEDVATQEYGAPTAEAVMQIIIDNPWLNWNINPAPGTKLVMSGNRKRADVHEYYEEREIKPVSVVDDLEGEGAGDFNNDYKNDYY